MDRPYTAYFDVRLSDLDAWGRLRTRSLLSQMEQAAADLSVVTGFDPAWYAAHGTAWTLRQVHLQRLAPAPYHDQLEVTIWVSSSRRVRLHTECEVRRADGTPIAVGRSEWVFIDRASRRPCPVDPAIGDQWPHLGPSALWTSPLALPILTPAVDAPDPHFSPHVIYSYEADAIGVTSNVVYADWFEDAAREALAAWGYAFTPSPLITSLPRLDLQALLVQYLLPTRPGDTVLIATHVADSTPDQVTLRQLIYPGGYPPTIWEMRPPQSGDPPAPLVEARIVYDWVSNPADALPRT